MAYADEQRSHTVLSFVCSRVFSVPWPCVRTRASHPAPRSGRREGRGGSGEGGSFCICLFFGFVSDSDFSVVLGRVIQHMMSARPPLERSQQAIRYGKNETMDRTSDHIAHHITHHRTCHARTPQRQISHKLTRTRTHHTATRASNPCSTGAALPGHTRTQTTYKIQRRHMMSMRKNTMCEEPHGCAQMRHGATLPSSAQARLN